MDFTTKIEIPKPDFHITQQNRLLMIGSCFIENIGEQLDKHKFNIITNPFGILYNPISISQSLEMLIGNKVFTEDDIFCHKGLYHSFYHHSRFSAVDKDVCLTKINQALDLGAKRLQQADVLFITFGTAYVFRFKDNNMVVGNCHKLPASRFDRYRLDVDTIVDNWAALIAELRVFNSHLKIIFTVSPIRHLKDGAHDNQLSKSTLLLAVDKLCQSNSDTYYFPSYEIVLDELRDYRFYSEDMIHPATVAIKYIWQRFRDVYFTDETSSIADEWVKIDASIKHRPFNEDSEEHKFFLRQTLLKLKTFQNKYPYICCEREIAQLLAKTSE